MNLALTTRKGNRAFTLIELIVVIVVLAILSGIAIPKYIDYTAKAKESAIKGALGAARSAVANYYANSALVNGTPTYPTVAQMNAIGTVLQEAMPSNPYVTNTTLITGTNIQTNQYFVAGVYPASGAPPVETTPTGGWCYDAASGRIWSNSATANSNQW